MNQQTISTAIEMLRDYMTVLAHEERPPVERVIADLEQGEGVTWQPLDMPDGPGWWAFEGKWNSEKVTGTFRDVTEVQFFQDELQVGLGNDWEPVTCWIGKWYRLTMPWEQQAPQGVSVLVPDWSTAPEWAMWHSIDKDGKAQWWESKPCLDEKYTWWLYDWGADRNGPHYRHERIEWIPEKNGIDWRTTLTQRPAAGQEADND